VAPSERAFFEAFFTWVYTPRAHADGTVDQIVEEALAFPISSPWWPFKRRSTPASRMTQPTASRGSPRRRWSSPPELDTLLPPRFGEFVAAEIPNARFEVMPGEAHQPFQDVPDEFNARVDALWGDVDARA
jgi:pimeloyl-ACP methyl ester carboxylesterase